ncbi:MAG: fumarate hydratase C-terminal domain-containing protein [Rhodospirillales bacterium]|jgi:L(+)-tartrate dehydratase beta subunit|nr:fumarate hydratase C-terminal domain-containing protein [Rhodospirillales bacterium]MDP7651254.1 fumarate hydratase C-terminal domain-containing protein [Rhodospirillales bacterium]
MAADSGKLKEVRLRAPVDPAALGELRIGEVVYLDGVVYTAREGVYKKVVEEGCDLPLDLAALSNVNFHCSPAATVNDDGGYTMGAVSATASFRFSKWIERWFDISGAKMIIGKGGMSAADYRRCFVPRGAVYLTTVGYGTGALLGRGVKRVREVHWIRELGIAHALWVLEVEKFGPFIVESDVEGNSLFDRENAKIAKGLPDLYRDSKPAILGRYGETDDRSDEVI